MEEDDINLHNICKNFIRVLFIPCSQSKNLIPCFQQRNFLFQPKILVWKQDI